MISAQDIQGTTVSVEVTSTDEFIKVSFDGKVHLKIYTEDLLGFQSWVERGHSNHVIEFTFKEGSTIITEYRSEKIFHAVLAGLDRET